MALLGAFFGGMFVAVILCGENILTTQDYLKELKVVTQVLKTPSCTLPHFTPFIHTPGKIIIDSMYTGEPPVTPE